MKKYTFTLLPAAILTLFLAGCQRNESLNESNTQQAPESILLEPYTLGSTRNTHRFGDIILAGQPAIKDLELASQQGVKTVINLRHHEEIADWSEAEAVSGYHMQYINLPFSGADELTDSVFDEVRHQLKSATRPVILHCSSANRVGAVWIPYRVLDDGIPLQDAVEEALVIGLRTPAYREKAIQYIEDNQ